MEISYLKQQIEVLKKYKELKSEAAREIAISLVDELKELMPIQEIFRHLGIPKSTNYRCK
jgi:DNA invertase Pin-like site-specific DNA recombinase